VYVIHGAQTLSLLTIVTPLKAMDINLPGAQCLTFDPVTRTRWVADGAPTKYRASINCYTATGSHANDCLIAARDVGLTDDVFEARPWMCGIAAYDGTCFLALDDGRVLRCVMRGDEMQPFELFAQSPLILRGNCLAIDSNKRLHFHSDRYTFVAPIDYDLKANDNKPIKATPVPATDSALSGPVSAIATSNGVLYRYHVSTRSVSAVPFDGSPPLRAPVTEAYGCGPSSAVKRLRSATSYCVRAISWR
jgi:hypothetical protein